MSKKTLGKFDGFLFRVEGEILAVAVPHTVIMLYAVPEEFMRSFHFKAIEKSALLLGTDEIHFSTLNDEFPCFGEVTLRGNEDGVGWSFWSWGEWDERDNKKLERKKK